MVRTTTRSFALPKAVAIMAGLGVAAGLAVAAPVHSASPSTAASRIVGARHHKRVDEERARHRTGRPEHDSRR